MSSLRFLDNSPIGRPFLFVPGSRSDKFTKAALSGADVVLCDLEDGVTSTAKSSTRSETAGWLSNGGEACVRVNGSGTPWHLEDLEAVKDAPGLRAVMVSKAGDPEALQQISKALSHRVTLIVLVETACGVLQAQDIAAAVPSVARLAFGSIDFSLDVRSGEEPYTLLSTRSVPVVAGRTGGTSPPIDGVMLAIENKELLAEVSAHAASLGLGGKLRIHPSQVKTVNLSFSPTKHKRLERSSTAHQEIDPCCH